MDSTSSRWLALGAVLVGMGIAVVSISSAQAQAQDDINPQELLESAKDMSGGEMLKRADTEVIKMKKTLGGVLELLESTRNDEKDLLKLNCIRESLAGVKGFLKVSEQSQVKLQEALSRDDRATSEHQYALVVIAGSKVSNLGVEAQSCAGEVLRYSGQTEVKFELGDIPEIDPTILIEELEVLFKLPEATPFQ
ncbi:MAG: hypothetical protein AAFS10_06695 [Myxococcota bacterium]